jgi:hypothetical protein
MLELGYLTRDGLDREAQVIRDIKPAEGNVDFDRRRHGCTGPLRQVEKEGGDAFVSRRPSEADDLILRRPDFAADLGMELRTEIRTLLD